MQVSKPSMQDNLFKNKKERPSIIRGIVYILFTWIVLAAAVYIFYWQRESTPVKELVTWALDVWPILAVICAGGIAVTGWIVKHYFIDKEHTVEISKTVEDDNLILLGLLDEMYQRQKEITRTVIKKLRSDNWEDMHSAYPYFMGLTDMDIEAEIDFILFRNYSLFMTGQPLTVVDDSTKLAERIKDSSLFTRNPEYVAKDVSIILRDKIPYLKKKLDHNRTLSKLLKKIERERDKYPNEDVSNAIDEYLDHSTKINATWVLSTYDLDHMSEIESLAGHRLPMRFKVILMGLPGRMDEEMRRCRNKVAVSILKFQKENKI